MWLRCFGVGPRETCEEEKEREKKTALASQTGPPQCRVLDSKQPSLGRKTSRTNTRAQHRSLGVPWASAPLREVLCTKFTRRYACDADTGPVGSDGSELEPPQTRTNIQLISLQAWVRGRLSAGPGSEGEKVFG